MQFKRYPDTWFSKEYITQEIVFFQFYDTGVREVSFLIVPAFCDQVVANLVVESDTGDRYVEISFDIVREK